MGYCAPSANVQFCCDAGCELTTIQWTSFGRPRMQTSAVAGDSGASECTQNAAYTQTTHNSRNHVWAYWRPLKMDDIIFQRQIVHNHSMGCSPDPRGWGPKQPIRSGAHLVAINQIGSEGNEPRMLMPCRV